MTHTEHLLTKLAEELAETQKEICKALCFGLDNHAPDSTVTNKQRIAEEFAHCVAVMEMLEQNNTIPHDKSILSGVITHKKVAVLRYMGYAKEIGTIG
jgi:hypothetical protein